MSNKTIFSIRMFDEEDRPFIEEDQLEEKFNEMKILLEEKLRAIEGWTCFAGGLRQHPMLLEALEILNDPYDRWDYESDLETLESRLGIFQESVKWLSHREFSLEDVVNMMYA